MGIGFRCALMLAVCVSASACSSSDTSVGGSGSGGSGTTARPKAGSGAAPGNSLTGTLGALGPVQPILAGFAITNGPETLVYLSSAPLTCAQMMMGGIKWLSKLPAKSQVIEIVIPGTASAKSYKVGNLAGEVHYAEGSKSSSTENTASSGTVVFSEASKGGVHEGSVMATFPNGMLMGMFHAEWCQGGTEF